VPYVIEPIGMFVPIVRNLWLKRMYHLVWGRTLFQGASAVIATSGQEVEEVVAGRVSRDKVVLRRNGVEVPASLPAPGTFRETQGISTEAKLVLFLGRLSTKKSPELLLQAFASLPAELGGNPLMLVYAGPDEGGMQAQLEQMASQLGVRTRVKFAGPIFGAAKWAAYRDADVFVLPSQNENFGNTAGEAVAAGTPVIVTEECGIAPLLAGEAGMVVPHERSALSQTLHRMLDNEEEHERLAAGCAKVTQRLGWEEPVREMEKLYTKLATEQATKAESQLPE
jgi:glycosyltransferase involved in cell wall biosynthesis